MRGTITDFNSQHASQRASSPIVSFAGSGLPSLLANQRASCALVQEAGAGDHACAEGALGERSSLFQDGGARVQLLPHYVQVLLGQRAVGLRSRRAGWRGKRGTARSLGGAAFRRRGRAEWGLCRVIASPAGPGLRALGGGGGRTRAEGVGVGEATGVRRLRLWGRMLPGASGQSPPLSSLSTMSQVTLRPPGGLSCDG